MEPGIILLVGFAVGFAAGLIIALVGVRSSYQQGIVDGYNYARHPLEKDNMRIGDNLKEMGKDDFQ